MSSSNLNGMLAQYLLLEKYSPQMQWGKKFYPDFFGYSFDIAAGIAAGASASANISIASDGSFIVTDLAGTLVTANSSSASFGAIEFENVTIQITDSGSGRNFFDRPIPFNHLFGQAGGNRYQLPVPKIVQNNATLTCTLTNNGSVAVTRVYGTFFGVKTLSR